LNESAPRPLADQLRPTTLEEVIGQDHLLAKDAPLGRMLESGRLSSLILWGPPGVGKTTLARIIADHADMEFVQLSAVFSGVADLRKVFEAATSRRSSFELNSALLSRAQVYVLKRLDEAAIDGLFTRAEAHLEKDMPVTEGGRRAIIDMAREDFTKTSGAIRQRWRAAL